MKSDKGSAPPSLKKADHLSVRCRPFDKRVHVSINFLDTSYESLILQTFFAFDMDKYRYFVFKIFRHSSYQYTADFRFAYPMPLDGLVTVVSPVHKTRATIDVCPGLGKKTNKRKIMTIFRIRLLRKVHHCLIQPLPESGFDSDNSTLCIP